MDVAFSVLGWVGLLDPFQYRRLSGEPGPGVPGKTESPKSFTRELGVSSSEKERIKSSLKLKLERKQMGDFYMCYGRS